MIKDIVKQHQNTPSFIIDLDHVRSNARSFISPLLCVQPHYTVKANPHPEIIKVLIKEDVRFEMASIAELDTLRLNEHQHQPTLNTLRRGYFYI